MRVDVLVGETVGSYRVLDVVARSPSAIVYKAIHADIGRLCAIKVSGAGPPTAHDLEVPQREAVLVNRVRHHGIVDIYECGALPDGRPYLVMEWLEGPSLRQLLSRSGPMAVADAVALTEELCAALSAVHATGVVHCDVRPDNIVMVSSGALLRPRLIGFGRARERVLADPLSAAADVQALGTLLFELLTGRPPDAKPLRVSALRRAAAALDEVVERCLRSPAQERFASADELGRALRRAASRRAGGVGPGSECVTALAIACEARIRGDAARLDAAVIDDVQAIVELVKRRADDAGLMVVDCVTGVIVLMPQPLGESHQGATRSRMRRLAGALWRDLVHRATAHPDVQVAIELRAGRIIVRRDGEIARLIDGELLRRRHPVDHIATAPVTLSGTFSSAGEEVVTRVAGPVRLGRIASV